MSIDSEIKKEILDRSIEICRGSFLFVQIEYTFSEKILLDTGGREGKL